MITISLGAVVTIEPCAGTGPHERRVCLGRPGREREQAEEPDDDADEQSRDARPSGPVAGAAVAAGPIGSDATASGSPANGTLMTTILADRSHTDHTRAPLALMGG